MSNLDAYVPLKTHLFVVKLTGFNMEKIILTLIKSMCNVACSYDGCICPQKIKKKRDKTMMPYCLK